MKPIDFWRLAPSLTINNPGLLMTDREKAEWLADRAGIGRNLVLVREEWIKACIEIIEAAYREGYSEGENQMIEAMQEF